MSPPLIEGVNTGAGNHPLYGNYRHTKQVQQISYGIPSNANDFLEINFITGAAQRTTLGLTLSGNNKFSGQVTVGSKLYAPPFSEDSICIIDKTTNTATLSNMGASISAGGNKWQGAVLGPDNKIYCIPWTAPDVLIIRS